MMCWKVSECCRRNGFNLEYFIQINARLDKSLSSQVRVWKIGVGEVKRLATVCIRQFHTRFVSVSIVVLITFFICNYGLWYEAVMSAYFPCVKYILNLCTWYDVKIRSIGFQIDGAVEQELVDRRQYLGYCSQNIMKCCYLSMVF